MELDDPVKFNWNDFLNTEMYFENYPLEKKKYQEMIRLKKIRNKNNGN